MTTVETVDYHTAGEPFRVCTACGHGTIALGVWAIHTGLVTTRRAAGQRHGLPHRTSHVSCSDEWLRD